MSEGKIHDSLIADITEQLTISEARRERRRVLPTGILMSEAQSRIIEAVSGDRVFISVVSLASGEWLLVKHPDYTDIFYALDGSCPACRTEVVRKTLMSPPGVQELARYDCAICDLGMECWEYRGGVQ